MRNTAISHAFSTTRPPVGDRVNNSARPTDDVRERAFGGRAFSGRAADIFTKNPDTV